MMEEINIARAEKEHQESKHKTFILDTSIYGKKGDIFYSFADKPGNKVVLTDTNIEELDRAKKKENSFGKNARLASNELLDLSLNSKSKLSDGVLLPSGGTLLLYTKYDHSYTDFKHNIDLGKSDMNLLRAALQYSKDHPEEDVHLVSMDRNLVLLAHENGINAEFKKGELIDPRGLYKGYRFCHDMDLYGEIISGRYEAVSFKTEGIKELEDLVTNEYILFSPEEDVKRLQAGGKLASRESIFRYDMISNSLRPIKYNFKEVLGFKPRNFEQQLAFDFLLDNTIELKALVGEAGTGKTFLSLLVALFKVGRKRKESLGTEKAVRPCIKITRRNSLVQNEGMGYLPGGIEDKNFPMYGGAERNYDKIANSCVEASNFFETHSFPRRLSQAVSMPDPVIGILPLAFIRGLSLDPEEILIIEEAQNMESSAMKSLVTRMGGGETYITGDVTQTDNTNTFEYDGLTHTVNAIMNTKDPRYAPKLGTLTLSINERSVLSDWASRYL